MIRTRVPIATTMLKIETKKTKRTMKAGKTRRDFASSSRDTTRIVSSSSSSSAVATSFFVFFVFFFLLFNAFVGGDDGNKNDIVVSFKFNRRNDDARSGASVKIVSDVAKYSSNSTRTDEQQREKQNEEKLCKSFCFRDHQRLRL